jgi:hypothetical protein
LQWSGFVVGAFVWTRMLGFYFIGDDFPHLYNARFTGLESLWSQFRYGQAGTFLRPLGFASIFADHALLGNEPFGYHLTNLILHLASAAGLFVLSSQLGVSAQIEGKRHSNRHFQKLKRTPSSTMRGASAVVDCPKNLEVITPLGLLKFR